jgi:hypothetical protein
MVEGKRVRVNLYAWEDRGYAVVQSRERGDFVYVTPESDAAFLPADEEPKGSLETILGIVR